MKRKAPTKREADEGVEAILGGLLYDPTALKMRGFIQHGSVTTYDHALSVARRCYAIAKGRRGIDLDSLVKAAFLHDLCLYDWHDPDPSHRLHGFRHAALAADNAARLFAMPPAVCDMIRTHMWPLNLTRVPHSREAWILTLSDKMEAVKECTHSLT